jgi:hypothetical protein
MDCMADFERKKPVAGGLATTEKEQDEQGRGTLPGEILLIGFPGFCLSGIPLLIFPDSASGFPDSCYSFRLFTFRLFTFPDSCFPDSIFPVLCRKPVSFVRNLELQFPGFHFPGFHFPGFHFPGFKFPGFWFWFPRFYLWVSRILLKVSSILKWNPN